MKIYRQNIKLFINKLPFTGMFLKSTTDRGGNEVDLEQIIKWRKMNWIFLFYQILYGWIYMQDYQVSNIDYNESM